MVKKTRKSRGQSESQPQRVEKIGDFRGGVDLSQNIKNTLYEVVSSSLTKLLEVRQVDEVIVLQRGVFELLCAPDLIFKISDDRDRDRDGKAKMGRRWLNVKRTNSRLHTYSYKFESNLMKSFDLLVLPRQTFFKLHINDETHLVIAEERLPLTNEILVHMGLYKTLGARLEPALRQLVAFIIATGFRAIGLNNIPILDRQLAPDAHPKIGLVDLSDCGPVRGPAAQRTYYEAFFGNGETSRGLFRCILPEHFEVVKAEALKYQVTVDEVAYQKALTDRKRHFEMAHVGRELMHDTQIYISKVKNIFEVVAKSLSVAIPPSWIPLMQRITNHLKPLEWRYYQRLEPQRFKVGPFDQSDLILRGVMVLEPKNRSLVALSMSIQGSIASSLTNTISLCQLLDHFCRINLMDLKHIPEANKSLLKTLPDEEGLFYSILADYHFNEDDNLPAVGRLQDARYLHQLMGSL